MASVVGLLEERELAARERVEGLREEADRALAELAEAETDGQEWLIARQRVGEVLYVAVTLRWPPLPFIHAGTGIASRTTAHSASNVSEGYRGSRSGWSPAFPNR
ncbi:hypothetical protein ACFVXE_35595 [Streptomyces sp. NPDC058231]|uniref:hypothetical protein n=1 Tax=Streptomyces sp. NPDC058231 TaxID=3346392 RepID=UPI0036ECD0CF